MGVLRPLTRTIRQRPKIGHDHFLPHPFQFTFDTSHNLMLCNCTVEKVSYLHKQMFELPSLWGITARFRISVFNYLVPL
jgi:hypothetical protein